MNTPSPTTDCPLQYADPARSFRARNPNRLLYAALACGLLPMTAGTTITALWFATRWPALILVGCFTVMVGASLALVGVLAIGRFLYTAHQMCSRPVRRWLGPGLFATALIAANFPLCALCIDLVSRCSVTVVNHSNAPITNFVVRDPLGTRWELGPIAPGGSSRRYLPVNGEGAVTFSATVNGTARSGTLDSYITGGTPGTSCTATFNADGSVNLSVVR